MAVLLITPEKSDEIKAVVAQARANVIPWETMRGLAIDDSAMPTGTLTMSQRKPGSERRPPSIAVHFEGGVTAALSFEEQPAGILRHLSVSTGRSGKNHLINPTILAMLATEFGFREFPPSVGRVWVEEYGPDYWAVNVVELEVEREAGHA